MSIHVWEDKEGGGTIKEGSLGIENTCSEESESKDELSPCEDNSCFFWAFFGILWLGCSVFTGNKKGERAVSFLVCFILYEGGGAFECLFYSAAFLATQVNNWGHRRFTGSLEPRKINDVWLSHKWFSVHEFFFAFILHRGFLSIKVKLLLIRIWSILEVFPNTPCWWKLDRRGSWR